VKYHSRVVFIFYISARSKDIRARGDADNADQHLVDWLLLLLLRATSLA